MIIQVEKENHMFLTMRQSLLALLLLVVAALASANVNSTGDYLSFLLLLLFDLV